MCLSPDREGDRTGCLAPVGAESTTWIRFRAKPNPEYEAIDSIGRGLMTRAVG